MFHCCRQFILNDLLVEISTSWKRYALVLEIMNIRAEICPDSFSRPQVKVFFLFVCWSTCTSVVYIFACLIVTVHWVSECAGIYFCSYFTSLWRSHFFKSSFWENFVQLSAAHDSFNRAVGGHAHSRHLPVLWAALAAQGRITPRGKQRLPGTPASHLSWLYGNGTCCRPYLGSASYLSTPEPLEEQWMLRGSLGSKAN